MAAPAPLWTTSVGKQTRNATTTKPAPRATRPRRTIPVHVLADERVHLALPHLGRLRQGQLKTLCDKIAVSELTPFALAGPKSARCRTCFGKVDAEGQYRG